MTVVASISLIILDTELTNYAGECCHVAPKYAKSIEFNRLLTSKNHKSHPLLVQRLKIVPVEKVEFISHLRVLQENVTKSEEYGG